MNSTIIRGATILHKNGRRDARSIFVELFENGAARWYIVSKGQRVFNSTIMGEKTAIARYEARV